MLRLLRISISLAAQGVLLLGFGGNPTGPPATPAYVQDAGSDTTGNTTTTTLGMAVATGDAVIGMSRDGSNNCGTESISTQDNGSPVTTWNNSITYSDTTNAACAQLIYGTNILGHLTTITSTGTPGGGAHFSLPVAEFTVVTATDGTAAGSTLASATSWATPNITTTHAKDVLLACLGSVGGQATGLTVSAGWTLFPTVSSNTARGTCAYRIVTSTGTYSATFAETGGALPAETLIGAFK